MPDKTMKKILIVEDELSIVNFISDVVRVLGYEVKSLNDGGKVFSTAKQWKPDVITLDILIPSPSGLEVLIHLKTDPETAPIPVLVMSGVTHAPEVKAHLHLAEAVFPKPFDLKDFIHQIQHLEGVPS